MHKGISGCSGLDVKKKTTRWTVLLHLLRIGSFGPLGMEIHVLSAVFTVDSDGGCLTGRGSEQRVLKSLLSQVGEHQPQLTESQNQTDNQSTSNHCAASICMKQWIHRLHVAMETWIQSPWGSNLLFHMERE